MSVPTTLLGLHDLDAWVEEPTAELPRVDPVTTVDDEIGPPSEDFE